MLSSPQRWRGIIESQEKKKRKHVCRQTSNVSRTLVGNEIVDHLDLVGVYFVGAAPISSQFSA